MMDAVAYGRYKSLNQLHLHAVALFFHTLCDSSTLQHYDHHFLLNMAYVRWRYVLSSLPNCIPFSFAIIHVTDVTKFDYQMHLSLLSVEWCPFCPEHGALHNCALTIES